MSDDRSWGSSRGNAAPRWQLQVAQLLLSQGRLAKLAVAAGESIGLAHVDIYFRSVSRGFRIYAASHQGARKIWKSVELGAYLNSHCCRPFPTSIWRRLILHRFAPCMREPRTIRPCSMWGRAPLKGLIQHVECQARKHCEGHTVIIFDGGYRGLRTSLHQSG